MKKIILLFGLVILAAVSLCLFWNTHLLEKALGGSDDPGERVLLLERADAWFPWNDMVRFELGKAYFERGVNQLGFVERRNADMKKGIQEYMSSLRLNPGALDTHFQLAQALLYMKYLSLPAPVGYFEEYKKTALLTGHNSEVYFEVSKVLLSKWRELNSSEKTFLLDILRKMSTHANKEHLAAILQIWDIHVKDYEVMDKILPEDADSLRLYAQFLGGKGLSLTERQKILSRAEALDFQKAKREFEAGERDLNAFMIRDAAGRMSECLRMLGQIRFYQNLTGRKLIDPDEFLDLRRSASLNLVKAKVEETRKLEDVEAVLDDYLSIEDRNQALSDLETFLKERDLLPGGIAFDVKNLKELSFSLRIGFMQNRYREITEVGASLERNLFLVTDAMKKDFLIILQAVGDSYAKLDYIYEAEKFYRKALDIDPGHPAVLFRLRKIYERLNNEAKTMEIDEKLQAVRTPRERILADIIVPKGEEREIPLIVEDGDISLEIVFSENRPIPGPLAGLEFNGQVVWEGSTDIGAVKVDVSPRTGRNRVVIKSLSGPVGLAAMKWAPADPLVP